MNMLRSVTQLSLPFHRLDLHICCGDYIKSKQRNCLQLESDLALAVSNVSPRTEELMAGNKTHVSH
jgi:hypothetical protein